MNRYTATLQRTPAGLLQRVIEPAERFRAPQYDTLDIHLLSGMNVIPNPASRLEDVAERDLARMDYYLAGLVFLSVISGFRAIVTYPPAVSGGRHRRGLYSEETQGLLRGEALATSEDKYVYLMGH